MSDGSKSRKATSGAHKPERFTRRSSFVCRHFNKNREDQFRGKNKRRENLDKRGLKCDGCDKTRDKSTCFKIHDVPNWYKELNELQQKNYGGNNAVHAVQGSDTQKEGVKDDRASVTDVVMELMKVLKRLPNDPIHANHAENYAGFIDSFFLYNSSFVSNAIDSDVLLWHKRLGHPSYKVLKRVPNRKTKVTSSTPNHDALLPLISIVDNSPPDASTHAFTPPSAPSSPEAEPIHVSPTPHIPASPHLPSPPPRPLRQSRRAIHKPLWLSDYDCNHTFSLAHQYFVAQLSILQEPRSYAQARGKVEWKRAMADEIQAFENNNTWSVTPLPEGKQVVGSKWVYKLKLGLDGSVSRYKARLVAKGYTQVEGVDYIESFSPVAKSVTVWLFLGIASAYYWPVHQLDINNAFLHGRLDEEGIKLSAEIGALLTDPERYRQLIRRLLYLGFTRPDVSFVVQQLSQFLHHPTDQHWAAALHVVRYLKGTASAGLFFPASPSFQLMAYADADWGACVDSHRSITGYCVLLGSSLISWKTKKQNTVSRSSAEAEYRAMAAAVCELQWITYLLQDFQVVVSTPIPFWCDNQAAIHITAKPVFHERTKHLDIDCHIVHDKYKEGLIQPSYVCSKLQVAILFTKSLPSSHFLTLLSKLGFTCPPAQLEGCVCVKIMRE
ncbi:UNVERIFIED_CONTAM: Retrovirus-related Pol polyprotein from transposon RE2 [Sesamum radiatum]|uniref:Retrovirus-related Pol polyprotein from transposon RE2 n=1 Tax=Sesamum radiatum TaxID=300843 RepID=A0AAW2PI09_SESRA